MKRPVLLLVLLLCFIAVVTCSSNSAATAHDVESSDSDNAVLGMVMDLVAIMEDDEVGEEVQSDSGATWSGVKHKREECFGAIGPQCDWTAFTHSRNLGYRGCIEMEVSVGSILHDICCVEHGANGKWCNGVGHGIVSEIAPWDKNQACEKEWRRAFEDSLHNRKWKQVYCTDPRNSNEIPRVVTAHTAVTPRPTAHVTRPNLWTTYFEPSSQHETDFTRHKLYAPSGTKMAYMDEKYCRSGRFRGGAVSAGRLEGYGICA